jgi:protein O-GlcNAc transferase
MSENRVPDLGQDGRAGTDAVRDQSVALILASLSDGHIADALAGIDAVTRRLGGVPLVFHLVGLASLRLNEPGKAVEAFRTAHQAEPDIREYSEALSIVMAKVGRLVDSLYYQKLSIAATREVGIAGLIPAWIGGFAEAFRNIPEAPLMRAAEAAFARGDYAAAAAAFLQESQVAPDSAAAWRGLARASLLGMKPFKSLAAAEALVALEPGNADNLALLGACLLQAARFDEAMAAHRRAEALRPDDADLAWQTIRTAGEIPGIAVAELGEAMIRWGKRFVVPCAERNPPRPAFASRKIRLGIVSGHWAEGDGLGAIVPVIELLDRRRIELFCYAAGQVDAALAVRIRQRANSWLDLNDTDDATAAVVIGNDDLDVLIDLDGPTRTPRPALFAARPAAMALSLYGIAEAAAALGFDGVVGGDSAWPAGGPGAILGIPGGIAVLPSNLTQRPPPPRGGRPVIFGSLAPHWRIGPDTAAAWAAILAAVPEAKIVLDLRRLGGLEAARDLATRFGAILPQDRVLSIDSGDMLDEYLPAVDLLLDPLDNPQSEDALAALALGRPVITCRSTMPRASLLATWLDRAGLGDLVAADRDAYVAGAAALAEAGRCEAITERVGAIIAAEMTEGAARQAARLGAAIHALVTERAA